METLVFRVYDILLASDCRAVRDAIERVSGVVEADIDPRSHIAKVTGEVAPLEIIEAVTSAGYRIEMI